jgi:hypothetical protein
MKRKILRSGRSRRRSVRFTWHAAHDPPIHFLNGYLSKAAGPRRPWIDVTVDAGIVSELLTPRAPKPSRRLQNYYSQEK